MKQAPQSILGINVSRIGDTLLAVPALRALASAWSGARLTVLGLLRPIAASCHTSATERRATRMILSSNTPIWLGFCDENRRRRCIETLLEALKVREVSHSENEMK